MVRYERANLQARINCVPDYFPYSTLASSVAEHVKSADALFFAVLTGTCKGIYTDFPQILAILRTEPEAHYVSHNTWEGIRTKWRQHCEQRHEHELPNGSISRSSSPVFSTSDFDFDASSCPSPTNSRRSSLDGPHPDLPPLTLSSTPPMAPKRPLRSTPPPSAPPSPSTRISSPPKRRDGSLSTRSSARVAPPRIKVSSSSVKGAPELRFPSPIHTSTPAPPPFPTRSPSPAKSPTKSPSTARRAVPQYEEWPKIPEAPAPTALVTSEGDDAPTVFYAVTVRNRLLVSHRRAFQLFKETPGAEMLLAASLEDATVYFERASGPTTMFAVSSERKVFRDRQVLIFQS
ncbi:hypothetical protein GGX14DRAFT_572235 [Mycena pura]|uniref:Uncharacterized protein n=1 Tax=Mycena pura TaxID=153505 RepID=A0AAD6Y5D0_9AGAR|nr:hypothetical protein GGX14DRAFT_572235 [Mycena pura]